jgi:predicted RND superfamily exporter protein
VRTWVALAAALVVVGGAAGALRMRPSLGLAGYGQRYLPGAEGADLRAVARHFPPPTALVVRVRGEPRFVAAPAALRSFDGVTTAVRADPAVVSALSVADLLAMVHRAFNPDAPPNAGLPDDAGLMARYLTLAYSPGFRRFVDRSLANAAIWIYVAGDDPTDLRRVLERVRTQLAAQPVPGAVVDLVGGDGAGVLLMADILRSLLIAAGVWFSGAIALLAALGGWRLARGGAAGCLLAVALGGGACGWLGVPLDLVSLPLLFMTAAAGTSFGALRAAAGTATRQAAAVASPPTPEAGRPEGSGRSSVETR